MTLFFPSLFSPKKTWKNVSKIIPINTNADVLSKIIISIVAYNSLPDTDCCMTTDHKEISKFTLHHLYVTSGDKEPSTV